MNDLQEDKDSQAHEVDELNEVVAGLESEMTELRDEISTTTQKLTQKTSEYDSLHSKAEEQSRLIKQYEKENANLSVQLKEGVAKSERDSRDLANLQGEYSECKSKNVEFERLLAAAEARAAILDPELKHLPPFFCI